MKKIIIYFSLILFINLMSCRAIVQGNRFAKCEFRVASADNFKLAGVNVDNILKLDDINILDIGKITLSIAQGKLPINFRLMVEVKNPNSGMAALNRVDWILEVDERDILTGTTSDRIEVDGGATANMPLYFNLDAKDLFNSETGNSLINLVLNLIGQGKENTRIVLKVKPTFLIAGVEVGYPGYIKLDKEFKSN